MEMIRRPPGDYRPSRRTICAAAVLVADGEDLPVEVLDISRDGAKVCLPFAILPGTAVELRVANATIPALIQWCKKEAAGLRFLDRLEHDVLVALEAGGDDIDLIG